MGYRNYFYKILGFMKTGFLVHSWICSHIDTIILSAASIASEKFHSEQISIKFWLFIDIFIQN